MRIRSLIRRSRNLAKGISLHAFSSRPIGLRPVWSVGPAVGDSGLPVARDFALFGRSLDLSRMRWRLDSVSGFEFATNLPFYLIRIDQYFDRGFDIKIPLELSRFYFALQLATNYRRSGQEEDYQTFRALVLDWIETNPFPRGINWLIPMEAGIRAVNWIVAFNIIGSRFWEDAPFCARMSDSLLQHARYLDTLPETGPGGHSTNHTVADYTGLLFLGLTLGESRKSAGWIARATQGLESCIRYQVNTEGAHLEGSLSYHRMVLEFFAYSAILCLASGVELSRDYYVRLASMFGHTARCVSREGLAPQLGDNDSGRLLHLQEKDEQNHGYLFALARTIFGEDPAPWLTQGPLTSPPPLPLLPRLAPCRLTPVAAEGAFHMPESGLHAFRWASNHLLLSLQKVGMAGQGGHNHIDVGSFTLVLGGQSLVVDPGSYTYTRSLDERQRYRSPGMHNVILTTREAGTAYSTGFWDIRNFPVVKGVQSGDRFVECVVGNVHGEDKSREIRIADDGIHVADSCLTEFSSLLHLHPSIQPVLDGDTCVLNGAAVLRAESAVISEETYDYSPGYDRRQPASRLVLRPRVGRALRYSITSI